MVLKTFNLNPDAYKRFSELCKENGVSMSHQIELFIMAQLEENPETRAGYLEQLESFRKLKILKKPHKHTHSYFG